MLRAFVALLIALNALFLAWTHGWLDGVLSVRAQGEREPERLARQINPQAVKLLSSAAVQSALAASAPAPEAARAADDAASAPGPTGCLEAGPFTTPAEQRAAADEIKRAALPEGAVASAPVARAGVYMVYMGKYTADSLQKKADELKRLKVDFEELRSSPGLEPGFSLGRFADKAAADSRLASLADRGVHTAKVVTLTPPATGIVWRAPQADLALATRLGALKGKNLGAGFAPCAAPAAAASAAR